MSEEFNALAEEAKEDYENENNAAADATEESEQIIAKPDELLPVFQEWIDNDVSEDEIIMMLHKDHNLSLPSAVGRFRKLKSQAGLTSPRGHKSEDVQAFIKDKVEGGMDRGSVIDAMVEAFGYTKKSAQSTFSTLGKKLGITGEGSGMTARVPMSKTVAFLRANHTMKKPDLINKMVKDLGYAESTCGAFYTYIPMAIEWAKQEAQGGVPAEAET